MIFKILKGNNMKIKISHDVYEISKRIKNIDKDYFIVYDTVNGKFEVHNSSQQNGSFCVSIPYDSLDERTLVHTLKSRSENIERILEEIDYNNKLKESADKSEVQAQLNEIVEDNFKSD